MFVDMGMVYKKIIESDPRRKLYGWFPLLAGCSVGQLGALMAESFCERIISSANLVLTDKNTKLGDDELEMLVVLKTNRDFMVEMRRDARFCKIAREQFGMTVLTKDQFDEGGEAAAEVPATGEGAVTSAQEDEVESVPVEHDMEDYDYADPGCEDLMENEWDDE
jgi:hypothetical protein